MMQIIRSSGVPAPDAITDNYSITEDQLLVGSANGFLNNDSDPDGDRLSIMLIDGRPFSFGIPITLASGANLTINADGSFQYDQNGSFTYLSAGQTVNDIFTYTISDGRFGFDTSAVCVTISGVTQGPPPTGVLHIEKDASVPGGTADVAGETISYTLAVTNQGNAAIANVVVDDPFTTNEAPVLNGTFNTGDTDQDSLLDVGETWQYTASHTVTQAELDAGTAIVNTATVTGDGAAPDSDDASVAVAQNKILHIEKDASVPGGTADVAGETISYTLAVTNTGNAAIANVVVDDPFTTNEAPVLSGGFNAGDTDQDGLLDVGETWQYTASHQVTQAELDAGTNIVNTATVTGTGATPDTDDASVAVAQSKILHIEKDATVADGTANSTSDTIAYTYTVTNQGNAAIAGVVVTDDNLTPGTPGDDFNPGFTGGDTDGDGLLDVGETWTYTASHTVTQTELDAGAALVNVATVTGTGATSDSDDASVAVAQSKILHLEKDATVADGTANSTSDVINYTLAVTNQGNAAIANVVVDDPFTTNEAPVLNGTFNTGDTDQDSLLDVGETWQYTASHTVTQAELDAGTAIVNTATVTGDGATPDSDDASVAVAQNKILHIEKDASVPGGTADVAGETISYTLT